MASSLIASPRISSQEGKKDDHSNLGTRPQSLKHETRQHTNSPCTTMRHWPGRPFHLHERHQLEITGAIREKACPSLISAPLRPGNKTLLTTQSSKNPISNSPSPWTCRTNSGSPLGREEAVACGASPNHPPITSEQVAMTQVADSVPLTGHGWSIGPFAKPWYR